jgi:hypothetical protein
MDDRFGEKKTFDEVLLESIDEVLAAIGNSIKCSIYLHLNNRGIRRNQIPNRIQDFMNVLQSTFGVGARHIELQLIKQIQAKTGITCPFSPQTCTLQECAVFIRQKQERI